MTQPSPLSFERHAAEQLLGQRAELTRDWVVRVATELQVRPRRVLPTEQLLDVFPEVLQCVAGFLCADEEPVLTAEPTVIDALRALARLRFRFVQEEQEGVWWVCVSDNGLGIPPEHHEHIFQRFFRAHPERSEGTGLGLAIVREAVQQLGGRIEFQSEPGTGSAFRVSLSTGEAVAEAQAS